MEQVEVDALLAHPLAAGGEHVDGALVARYAAVFDELPPVVAMRTPEGLLLVDGYHRCRAAQLLGRRTVTAEVRDGTLRDALDLAVTLESARSGASPSAIRSRILARAALRHPGRPGGRRAGQA